MTTTIPAPTTPATISPLHVLQHKKDAELAQGAFARYEPIEPHLRSRYSPTDPLLRVELGLGNVQGVLATLHGIVTSFSYDAPGLIGRIVAYSANRSSCYQFTWRQDSDRFLMGGFVHSRGQPTYQAAIIALVQAVAAYRSGDIMQSTELVERWYALIGHMEYAFPRRDITAGWDRSTLAAACKHPGVRPHIIQVCDALRTVLTYRLADLTSREPGITAHDVISREVGNSILVPGALLLDPAGVAILETSATATSADSATPDAPPLVVAEAAAPGSTAAETPPAKESAPAPIAAPATPGAATPAEGKSRRRAASSAHLPSCRSEPSAR